MGWGVQWVSPDRRDCLFVKEMKVAAILGLVSSLLSSLTINVKFLL